jgi:hypothetical protein
MQFAKRGQKVVWMGESGRTGLRPRHGRHGDLVGRTGEIERFNGEEALVQFYGKTCWAWCPLTGLEALGVNLDGMKPAESPHIVRRKISSSGNVC